MGSIAGDATTVILPPLAAMLFIKIGYHPIAVQPWHMLLH